MKNKLKAFFELYFAFMKIGAFTFGGGLAMMPIMQRELIEKRGWLTEEELIDYFIGNNIYQTTDEVLLRYYDAFLSRI